jgi:hypothetical protein
MSANITPKLARLAATALDAEPASRIQAGPLSSFGESIDWNITE